MCFLAFVELQGVFSKSILRALLLNASHETFCDPLIALNTLPGMSQPFVYTASSVSCGQSKFTISKEFFGFWMAFRVASVVDTLLVVSHPVNAWNVGRHSSPSAPQVSWSDSTDLWIALHPELLGAKVPPADCYVIQNIHKDIGIAWWQCNGYSGCSYKDITHIMHTLLLFYTWSLINIAAFKSFWAIDSVT